MATIQNINTTVIIVVITAFTTAFYLFYQPSKRPNKSFTYQNTTDHAEVTINETITLNTEIIKPLLLNPRFPQCYAQIEYSTLSEILYQYHLNNTCVGPKCSIRTKKTVTSKENAGLLVAYVAVTLLLISLIAAFLEVIKAKKEVPVKNKTKPELSRRCSLADLTVLRHNRRESMIRRDSTLSIDDSTKRTSLKTIGRKMSRPRLRVA